MANNTSAEKRIGQNIVRRERNRAARSEMRKSIKRLRTAVEAGDAQTAQDLLPETLETIDRTARKNVVHRNVAARTKSRLVRTVRALAGS